MAKIKGPHGRPLAPRRVLKHAANIASPVPDAVPRLLSFVAGYVDSCTFLALFGLFVAQATGSFVVAGAQLAEPDHGVIVKILAIPLFLLGAALTTFLGIALNMMERPALAWCLVLETLLLAGFYYAGWHGAPLTAPNAPWSLAASLFAISAMGVQSALVRLLMSGVASTNVMTTNTTLLGIDLAEYFLAWYAKRNDPKSRVAAQRYRVVRHRFSSLLSVMLGFLVGASAGAVAFDNLGWPSLGLPILIVAGLSCWAFQHER